MRFSALFRGLRGLPAAVLLALPAPAAGQDIGDDDTFRFGLSFGGISTVGVQVEYLTGSHGFEATLGTWSFRDIGASLVFKEYLGGGSLRPFLGGGVWLAAAPPFREGERTGAAFIVQAPVGVDWRMFGQHHAGLQVNLNRALWIRRADPDDPLPPAGRLVPLPGTYYRYRN